MNAPVLSHAFTSRTASRPTKRPNEERSVLPFRRPSPTIAALYVAADGAYANLPNGGGA